MVVWRVYSGRYQLSNLQRLCVLRTCNLQVCCACRVTQRHRSNMRIGTVTTPDCPVQNAIQKRYDYVMEFEVCQTHDNVLMLTRYEIKNTENVVLQIFYSNILITGERSNSTCDTCSLFTYDRYDIKVRF